MPTCKNCGKPIMELSFKEGKMWWHVAGAVTYTACGQVADDVPRPLPVPSPGDPPFVATPKL